MTADQTTAQDAGPLHGIRVLDLATERAELTGCVLADLGAEVIKIEPPEGAASRRLAPFRNLPDGSLDGSLYWAAYGRGKRSLVLDLEGQEGRERFRKLAATADLLVESFDPGYLEGLGLDYDSLRTLNPALIHVSVTPWGQTGPLASDPASDLTVLAACGLLGMQGDGDRPPVPVGYPQAAFHAGIQAAADAVIALNERDRSGLGQHLDVSMQAAMILTLMQATGFPPNEGRDPPGYGPDRAKPRPPRTPGLNTPEVLACADGFVTCLMGPFPTGLVTMVETAAWMKEEGEVPPEVAAIHWPTWPEDVEAGRLTLEQVDAGAQHLIAFIRTKTKRELFDRAFPRKMLIAPINTVADLFEDEQFHARSYWVEIEGTRHPGAFALLSRTPIRADVPAPALGEADGSLAERAPAKANGNRNGARKAAFEGIKVADFAWAGVGPIMSKALADHGATVVRVESAKRPDVVRLLPPYKDGIPGMDRTQFMSTFNSSKLGMALDLSGERGRSVARRLIDWADVVVESFSPGTMDRLGLGWAEISRDRPDLVMMSTSLRGQTGPYRTYGGYGNQGAAIAGIHGLTGWPDRVPCGPWGAYTDFISPRFGIAALAAALHERRSSGKGQHIDLAQVEASMHAIAPVVLDYTANGRVAGPAGLSSPWCCPHGVYRTQGEERYVALSVETVKQWRALLSVAPLAQFADARIDEMAERRAVASEVDAVLQSWCAEHEPFELAGRLRSAGVPASVAAWPSDLYRDPQLSHREFFVTLNHTVMGPTPYDGLATRFSETPGRLRKAAPTLGEDTEFVLRDLLRFDPNEIAEHRAAGILA